MSNTGQTVSKQDDIQYHMFSDDNGDWVCHHFYLDVVEELEQRIAELENQVEFEMNEKGLARIKRNEYAKRVDELELALLYYADEVHFKNGDVPGHIYALDDAGHIARNALGIDQKEVDRRVLATYYTE